MKKYILKKLNNSKYDYLVISLTFESVLVFINSLEKELKKEINKIIFDLALVNGTKKNRYTIAIFENGKVDISSFKILSPNMLDDKIKSISLDYFLKHKNIFKNSVLNKIEINKLLNYS